LLLSVHRWHGRDGWFASCELFDRRPLKSNDGESAKLEAFLILRREVNAALKAMALVTAYVNEDRP
jgi:hypothetical protein